MAGQRDLNRMMKYWQKKLALQDWRTTIRFASLEELTDCQGINEYNDESKTSEVKVLFPDQYDPSNYPNNEPQDIEVTVVHELLHLHLAPWDVSKNKAQKTQQEQAIEAIARALVALKRRTK